jgi:hypothetical protein
MLALGQMLIAQATELRNGSPVKRRASRKGLTLEEQHRLICKRNRSAFKPSKN